MRIIYATNDLPQAHHLQAPKFLSGKFFTDIISAKAPMEAAKLGRDRSRPLRDNREEVKVDIMPKQPVLGYG